MTDINQIRSNIRMWILLDMVQYEVANYVGIEDRYIEKHRKQAQKELNGILQYITKRYNLKFTPDLHDYTADCYDIFTIMCKMGDTQLAKLKEEMEATFADSENPSVSA